jgi:hypothetical protein
VLASHIQTAVKPIGSPFSSPFGLQLTVNLLLSPSDHQRPDHTAVRQIGSPFRMQLTVNLLMSPSDHQGLIKLLSSRLELEKYSFCPQCPDQFVAL